MKKIFRILGMVMVCALSAMSWSCSDDDDSEDIIVTFDQLPQNAKDFVTTYYNGVAISRIEKDFDADGVEFEVYFANGHDVTFNAQGEWIDVDAPAGQTVPDAIVPVAISEDVMANYLGSGINEISKNAAGYEVDLINGTDLLFDPVGNFVGIGH